jgi:hypothetical protein
LASKYLSGNTIKLKAVFTDSDTKEKVDPDIAELRIYDKNYVLIDKIVLDNSYRTDVGTYKIQYVFKNYGFHYYEFYGKINQYPTLTRNKVEVRFIFDT